MLLVYVKMYIASVINMYQKLIYVNNSVSDCNRLIEIADEMNGKSETRYNCDKSITGYAK